MRLVELDYINSHIQNTNHAKHNIILQGTPFLDINKDPGFPNL